MSASTSGESPVPGSSGTAAINTTHAETVRAYNVPGECHIVAADWPYECIAKEKNPDHRVFVCETHRVWWHHA